MFMNAKIEADYLANVSLFGKCESRKNICYNKADNAFYLADTLTGVETQVTKQTLFNLDVCGAYDPFIAREDMREGFRLVGFLDEIGKSAIFSDRYGARLYVYVTTFDARQCRELGTLGYEYFPGFQFLKSDIISL